MLIKPTVVRNLLLFIYAAAAFCLPVAAAESPGSSPRITQDIDDTARVSLTGTTPGAVRTAHDLGTMDGSRSLRRILLVLTPSSQQREALQHLLESQHTKDSPDYHHWLTPEQFAAKFGPSDDDLAKIKGWLQSHGLKPTSVGRGRGWIEFDGSVEQINRAFRTSMHHFEANGQRHIANSSDISIPSALAPLVGGVLSLNDFRARPAHARVMSVKRNSQGNLVSVDPNYTTTDGNGNTVHYLAPADFQKIYNVSPLLAKHLDGKGTSIAIPGRSDIYLADVQTFRRLFGLPRNDPNFIINGPDPGLPSADDVTESSLDVEWAGAVAPAATINFVVTANTDTTDGISLSSAYIVDNVISPIMSVSYGLCEALMGPTQNQFYDSLWRQAAAEGITVFVSTGDVGAAQCDGDLQRAGQEPRGPVSNGHSINGLSSTAFNIAVGGTQFDEGAKATTYWSNGNTGSFESALGYIPEQVWNESCDPALTQSGANCPYGQTDYNLASGGGGPSTCSRSSVDRQGNVQCIAGYPKPSWQKGTGVPDDGVRDTPDLSLNASPDDDGYLTCFFGSCETQTVNGQTVLTQAAIVGGTSAAAPAMAGIMALVEQRHGVFQGQANYVFYKLAQMDAAASCNSSARTAPTRSSPCNFNDITLGNNSVPGLVGYGSSNTEWAAGPGYDMATGLGSVNAANLVANWTADSLSASKTQLTSNTTVLSHGQRLTLAIDVAPAKGSGPVPTGDVALITDKYGAIGSVALDGTGHFYGPVNDPPGGTYNLTARYGGDGNFSPSSSAPISLTVAPEGSTTSFQLTVFDPTLNKVVPYAGSSQYGYPVFLDVQVAGRPGGGSPTGTINIRDGNTVVLSSPLNAGGSAHISTGFGAPYTFEAGAHTVSVQYLGDHSFTPSVSPRTPLNIGKQQVLTEVGISAPNVPVGQPVFLTGSLVSGYTFLGFPYQLFPTLPTGTMQFYDNGVPLGKPIILMNESGNPQAPYTPTFSGTGVHNITAAYSGDRNYAAVSGNNPQNSVSSFNVIPATGAATVTTIVQSPTAVTYGQSLTYIVTVTPVAKGGPVPTGQVWINGRNGGFDNIIDLVNGQGVAVEQPGAGSDQLYAQYMGDSYYAPSTSPIFITTVARANTRISLTTPSASVSSGEETSLNFVVAAYHFGESEYYQPSGTVEFFSAVNGGIAQAITAPLGLGPVTTQGDSGLSVRVTLPKGTNIVTARYSGDFYLNPETSAPVKIVVRSSEAPSGEER